MKKRRNRQQWLQLVEEQKASGLSVAQFCRENGIHPNSFYNFARREAERNQCSDNELVEIKKPETASISTPQALIRIGSIEIIPGQQPDQETMALLFKSALEASNASFR